MNDENRRNLSGGGCLEEGVWRRVFGGGCLEEGVWRRVFGGGCLEEGVWRRVFGGGCLEEGVWRRVFGGVLPAFHEHFPAIREHFHEQMLTRMVIIRKLIPPSHTSAANGIYNRAQ